MHPETQAWETWNTSGPEHKVLWIACSLVWLALCGFAAHSLDPTVPYLPLAIAGALIFYLRSTPRIIEQAVWLAVSLAFAPITHFPHTQNWIIVGSSVLSLFGLGAFAMLGLRWLWSGTAERRRTYSMLAPAAALVFFVFSAQRALSLANLLYPKTYDLYLYVFDGSLGFQPSFLAGRAMASSLVLRVATWLTYMSLPFVMALVYALRLPKGTERPSWDMISLFMLAGIGGWALYNIVPATGPAYVFGPDFPGRYLEHGSLHRLLLEQIPVNPDIPRNAIPSLHMAWVLLLFWNTKGLSRALRIFMAIYLALTVIGTMGVGEHYFVDLVAGVPFALFVQSVVSPGNPAPPSRRATAAVSALGLTLAWLLLIRSGTKWMLVSPILPWSLVLATGIGVGMIKTWFDSKQKLSADPDNLPQAKAQAASAHN